MPDLLGGLLGSSPIDAAIRGGFAATTVGEAFMAGYQAALRTLVPDASGRACLCATEEGGAHPRAIRATLTEDDDGWLLTGDKRWVTGGPLAERLLVVATTGLDDAGRNRLRVAWVDAKAQGVTMEPMPPTPFTPEIPHSVVHFARVRVGTLLPGDGYDRYLKPFRTIEDTHVHAAVMAYLLATARRWDWPHDVAEEIIALIVATRTLAVGDPSARETHLGVAGALRLGRAVVERCRPCWERVRDEDVRKGWERDAPLLDIASKVRAQRTEAAWKAVG